MLHEVRDVLWSLAKRGNPDGKDTQAVEEIFPKGTPPARGSQIAIRGGDHPDVDPNRLGPADALELPGLEDTEKRGLRFSRELAHLVEEQRALVRQLEPSDPPRVRAGERAAFVPKQLALHQVYWESAAIDPDHGPGAACA